MTSNFMEYYFLSSCYEQGVSEETVYKLFIEKVIADYPYPKFPFEISISNFHNYIKEKYKIEIPPTFIKSLIKSIDENKSNLFIKKEKNHPFNISLNFAREIFKPAKKSR